MIKMVTEDNKRIKPRNTATRGSISCKWGISVRRESPLKEAICEKCDKVFKTAKDEFICPDCQKKAENK